MLEELTYCQFYESCSLGTKCCSPLLTPEIERKAFEKGIELKVLPKRPSCYRGEDNENP